MFKKHHLVIFIGLILGNVIIAFSQGRMLDRSSYYSYGERYYVDALVLPLEGRDSVEIDIIFKIVNDYLAFTQKNSDKSLSGYYAYPLVEIECRDSVGIIRKRLEWRDTIYKASYEETTSKTSYTYGSLKFHILTGDYNLRFKISPDNIKKQDVKEIPLKANLNFHDKPTVSIPLMAFSRSQSAPNYLIPFILSGNMGFTSRNGRLLFPVSYNERSPGFYYFRLEKTKASKDIIEWNGDMKLDGTADLLKDAFFDIGRDSATGVVFKIKESNQKQGNSSSLKIGLLNIDLPADKILPGSYSLKLFLGGSKDTLSMNFDVVWENVPLSLKYVDYAVQTLYYIMTDDEFDKLDSGSDKDKFNKLLEFWKKKDPTPNTPYNEAMAEYYRRVDYAFFNFQSLAEKDGAATERGKIYILYGQPSKIDRSMSEGKTVETWMYDNLGKKFTFELVSGGKYKLVKVDPPKS